MMNADQRNISLAATALLASSATLVCCVLPAVLVSLGAGATLVALVSAMPQLVWVSEHKPGVFGIAALMLVVAGVFLRNARSLPCPSDHEAARQCSRLRALSNKLYAIAASAFVAGVIFAFGLARL